MSIAQSYLDKQFTVTDSDARIRDAANLIEYLVFKPGDLIPPGKSVGDPKTIPDGFVVAITEVKMLPTGSKSSTVFAKAVDARTRNEIGWTSTRNLAGGFVNETLGTLLPSLGDGRFGPNAAWSGGSYLGQVDLVRIVDVDSEIETIAVNTVKEYFAMTTAALRNSVKVTIKSGFRSYPEQKHLFEGFSRGLPGFNKAAKPGFSNHQNGTAFDIAVSGGVGNNTYDWLCINATSFGFVRTVSREPWHWEFNPTRAKAAKNAGTFKTPNVRD